ncbi:MAG: hypothetical protein JSW67_00950 [Candidatus Latescibacterota bacterium]|nr:MAG: hypothetical protein JSW67_00950 [Candidatus Latescibacterota bacterium]
MKRAFARMKSRWGVGPLGVIAILLVFSLTGSSVVLLRRPIMGFLLPADAPTWLHVVLYLLVIFPLYQVLLLVYGALFGQFRFFWEKEKQLLLLLRRVVARRPVR